MGQYVQIVNAKCATLSQGVWTMGNMRDIRKKKHLTLVYVQTQTGIDHSLLSKYERGERMPTAENLILLAKLYNTSLDYLMELTDTVNPYPVK